MDEGHAHTDSAKATGAEASLRYTPAVAKRKRSTAPPRLRDVIVLDDLEAKARRHLPKPIFGYVSGNAEAGISAAAQRDAFSRHAFVPRVLKGTANRNQSVELFGTRYDHPFGVSPMGVSTLVAYDGDVTLAKGAREAGSFAVMSATSLTPLERVAREAGSRWFQAYFPGQVERIEPMLDRIAAAGFDILAVTADVPVKGNNVIDRRNRFGTPIKPTLRLAWEGITHPHWLLGTALKMLATHGLPHFENLDVGRGPPILARDVERSFSARELLSWDHIARIRELWRGKLVIKGIVSPEDAATARDLGCDGIIVSSHGGRQLDSMVSPLAALPAVKARAGGMVVMLDSGVRYGADVLKAMALGADFVFVGRPMLYAAALAGETGVRHAVDILSTEIDRNMALLGLQDLDQLTRDHLTDAHAPFREGSFQKGAPT